MTKQNKGRKLFAVSASAALVASAIVPVAASAAYSDESSIASWATESVKYVTEKGFMQGDNGNFDPQGTFTRAQAAVVAAKVLGLDTTKEFEATFGDVKEGQWFFEEVSAAAEAGIIKGSNGNFRPNDKLTRQEAAVILAKIYGLDVEAADVTVLDQFSDKDSIASYAAKYLAALVEADIIKGSNGKLNPTGNIARQELAVMLSKADQAEVEVEVDPEELLADLEEALAAVETAVAALPAATEVTKENATDAQAKATAAQTAIDAAQAALDAVVEVEALTEEEVQEAQTAIDAAQAKVDAVKTAVAEATKPVVGLAVESVSAINAEEILVTFNSEVDTKTAELASNYELKVSGNVVALEDIVVSGKTVLIRVDTPFVTGDIINLQTKDSILDKTGKPAEKFTSDNIEVKITAKPAIKEVAYTTGKLTVEFDRPVDQTVTLLKLDDIAIATGSTNTTTLTPVDDTEAGNYKYEVVLTGTTVATSAAKLGKHELTIFDVADTTGPVPNTASVLTGSYTITETAEVAPEVVSVTALNANKFFIELNKAADLAGVSSLSVSKGNHTFTTVAVDGTAPATTSSVYAQAGSLKGKPGYYVVVTDAATTSPFDVNPLYGENESSVTLKVKLNNYSEAASTLIGKAYEGSVTLKKADTKPVVESTTIDTATKKLVVTFEEGLDTLPATPKVVVRDKDGVVITPSGSGITLNGTDSSKLEIELASVTDEPYTVEIAANEIQYAANASSVADYVVKSNKNDKITTTVKSTDANTFKYKEFATSIVNTTVTNNQILIDYAVDMDDSAKALANYKLDGKALPAGTQVDFLDDKQNVRITLPENFIKTSTSYKFTISTDVLTKAGEKVVASLLSKAPVEQIIGLTDNVAPKLAAAKYVVAKNDVTITDEIYVSFSEVIDATDVEDFKVVVNGATQTVTVAAIEADADGNNTIVKLTLDKSVNVAQAATVTIVEGANPGLLTADVAGNTVVAGDQVTTSGKEIVADKATTDASDVSTAKGVLAVGYASGDSNTSVTQDVTLPLTGSNATVITWASSHPSVVSATGKVTRPASGSANVTVTLTATIKKGSVTDTQTFTLDVIALP